MTEAKSSLNQPTPGCNAQSSQNYKPPDFPARQPLLPSTAAEQVGQFLHETGLLGLLPSRLRHRGAGGRDRAVRCQILLAVLELRLRRGCLRGRKFSQALPLDLRIAVHIIPWAASGLGARRTWLGQRLVETVVINGQMRLLLSVLSAWEIHGHG